MGFLAQTSADLLVLGRVFLISRTRARACYAPVRDTGILSRSELLWPHVLPPRAQGSQRIIRHNQLVTQKQAKTNHRKASHAPEIVPHVTWCTCRSVPFPATLPARNHQYYSAFTHPQIHRRSREWKFGERRARECERSHAASEHYYELMYSLSQPSRPPTHSAVRGLKPSDLWDNLTQQRYLVSSLLSAPSHAPPNQPHFQQLKRGRINRYRDLDRAKRAAQL